MLAMATSYNIAMTPSKRVRVAAYVTRRHRGKTQLLTFHHRDHPEAGVQVPAGGVKVGETLTQAVHREVWEESGLRVEAGDSLGLQDLPHPVTGDGRLTVFFHAPIICETGAWTHTVSVGEGEEFGLVFDYEFVDLNQLELPFGQGQFLAYLPPDAH